MPSTFQPCGNRPAPGCEAGAGIWPRALADLKLQMPGATFDTWLKSTTAELHGNTLTVVVANPFAQDWLEHRLRPKIEDAVTRAAGRPLTVVFAVNSNGTVTPERQEEQPPAEPEIEHYEIWAPADPTVLRVLPDLAEEIGLNESIVLLQLDHWLRHSNNVRDGRRWTYQSLRGMQRKAFKWWSKDTISRAIATLEAQELIVVTDRYNQHQRDQRWFTLNVRGFQRLGSIDLKQKHCEIWAPANPTVLRIMPDLAEEIGLNESIVLLQISYWIRRSNNVRDGRRWTYQSIRDMQRKVFKWWSRETVRRAIMSLGTQDLIFVTDEYNRHRYDTTHWYALNPRGFKRLKSVALRRVTTCG